MFGKIVPSFVSTFMSLGAPADFQLTAEEQAATQKYSDRRMRDFMHGRYCAHSALANLGIRDASVGVGAFREPEWPAGVVGSITHTADIAAAAVCRSGDLQSLGIDCEAAGRITAELTERICLACEITGLSEAGFGPDYAEVLFSAKESVYKCIWPHVRRFVDFHEVTIALDAATGRFTVAAVGPDIDNEMLSAIDGRWHVDAGHIYTAALL